MKNIKNKNNKNLVILLCIGLIIKLLTSFFTYHPDTQALQMTATIINQNNLWLRMYDYIPQLPHNNPIFTHYGPKVMNYPPAAYWFQAIWYKITSFVISPQINQQFINGQAPLTNRGFNFLLLVFKLKYLFFDMAITYLIYLITKKKTLYALVWWLNPFSLYATYMIGQFGIIPLFFSLLAYYLIASKHKYLQAAFWLGVGGAFKIFPLLFLPFLATKLTTFKKQVLILAIGLLTYILPTLPFIHSYGYRTFAMIASQTDKIFYAKIMLTGAEYISIFAIIYVALLTLSYLNKIPLWLGFWSIMAVFFSLVHFHPQWIIFIIPWSILYLSKLKSKDKIKTVNLFIGLCLLFIIIIFSFDASLNINLFNPLASKQIISNNLVPLAFINQTYPFHDFMSLIRSLWAGLWFGLLYQTYRLYSNQNDKV